MLKKTDEKLNELSSMQRLLSNPEEKVMVDLVKRLSPKGEMVQKENEYGIFLEKNKFSEEFGVKCFSTEEIIDECQKYDLVFIRCTKYTGAYNDLEFVRKIDNIVKNAPGLNVHGDHYGDAMWLLGKRDHSVKIDKQTKFKNDDIRMYFFKVPGQDYYALLNHDESHINAHSIYMGFRYFDEFNLRLSMFIENLIAIIIILFGINYHKPISMGGWGWTFSCIGVIVAAIVVMLIRMRFKNSHTGEMDHSEDYFSNSINTIR